MPDSLKPPELDFSLIVGAAVVFLVISAAGIFAVKSQGRDEKPLANANTVRPAYTTGTSNNKD